jgi:hypothetical protein
MGNPKQFYRSCDTDAWRLRKRKKKLIGLGFENIHNEFGILRSFPIEKVFEVPYKCFIIKISILCKICHIMDLQPISRCLLQIGILWGQCD